jgi:hypothetical protein
MLNRVTVYAVIALIAARSGDKRFDARATIMLVDKELLVSG